MEALIQWLRHLVQPAPTVVPDATPLAPRAGLRGVAWTQSMFAMLHRLRFVPTAAGNGPTFIRKTRIDWRQNVVVESPMQPGDSAAIAAFFAFACSFVVAVGLVIAWMLVKL